jgi:predicted ribonuclease YlaK
MSKRLLVIDTGVFLHCQFFDQLDWHKWVSAKEVTLTLCPTVIGQLDDKKRDSSRRLRDRAQSVIKRIESLISDDTPVPFRKGCLLWAICREPRIDMTARSLSRECPDDLIIANALEQKDAGCDVSLVAIDL